MHVSKKVFILRYEESNFKERKIKRIVDRWQQKYSNIEIIIKPDSNDRFALT